VHLRYESYSSASREELFFPELAYPDAHGACPGHRKRHRRMMDGRDEPGHDDGETYFAFPANTVTSSIASTKREFSSASASAFDCWIRSLSSFMCATACW
jgi:hypothetical protein